MSMLFGSAGELLTPLDDLMDGDIKLSLELGLELKDPLGGIGGYGSDDWCGWSSLRSSPTFDIFGDRELVMVSPESVMPLIKREIKQERLPTPEPAENIEPENDLEQLRSEIRAERIKQEEDEEELVEEEEEEDEEENDNEEEEEEEVGGEEDDDDEYEEVLVSGILPPFKPKEKHLWTPQVLTTRPTMVKTEPGVYQQRHLQQQQASSRVRSQEVVVPRTAQTLRVMHPAKNNLVNPRSLLVKKNKSFEGYPKPAYSYSCLIAMALKNSITGSLPVAEIYNFMCEHFPYFKSAPSGWKNSVRHNLSLNKCFEKIEKTSSGGGSCRKGCLWAMNPAKVAKMDDEVAKWSKKDPLAIRRSMRHPEELERMEKGNLKIGSRRVSTDSGADEDMEEDEEEIEEEEDDEEDSDDEREVPPSLKRFDSRLSSQSSGTSSQTYDDLGLPDEMYNELNLLEEVMSEAKRPRLGVSSQASPARHPSHHLYVRHHLASQV